ncbi:two-component system response regulator LytT [Bacilli bacterium PM5-3]|nr:two-component system response regulator LytT [Bacilli bacterium PM5-3]
MTTIEIAICEDNPEIQNRLKNIIFEYYNKTQITANIDIFSNGNDFLQSCMVKDYSFILMDIDLDQSNGIETVKKFRKHNKIPTPIIFITSYEEHKNIVLPLHTFDYIVKPFKDCTITNILNELSIWIKTNEDSNTSSITFKTIDGTVNLNLNNIMYFEYNIRKVDIVTSFKTFQTYSSIKKINDELDAKQFAMPHSSFIVNMKKIYTFSSKELTMENGFKVPIARSRLKEFRELYLEFVENNTI